MIFALLVSMSSVSILPAVAAHSGPPPSTLPGRVLVHAPPPGAKGPDDITIMAVKSLDGGKALIWVAYQNGINPDGSPGSPGGPTQSAVAAYDPRTGALVTTIMVTGKVDGLTADPFFHMIIATVNEDDNSAFNFVDPATGTVTTYTYSPNPAVGGVGGTDSIAVMGPFIYLAHSNPSDTTQATDYGVTLNPLTHVAHLQAVFSDDSSATDVNTGQTVQLALTDPDTNCFMPQSGEAFAGSLATVSQGDGKIVFATNLFSGAKLQVLSMSDNVAGNVPPIDGLAVATSDKGALYVVDNAAGTITALVTNGWATGTTFVGEPSDNSNPLIGTLNLSTGQITPLGNAFQSPKGMLFVPLTGIGAY